MTATCACLHQFSHNCVPIKSNDFIYRLVVFVLCISNTKLKLISHRKLVSFQCRFALMNILCKDWNTKINRRCISELFKNIQQLCLHWQCNRLRAFETLLMLCSAHKNKRARKKQPNLFGFQTATFRFRWKNCAVWFRVPLSLIHEKKMLLCRTGRMECN